MVLGLVGLMIYHGLLLCLPNLADVDNSSLLGNPVPLLSCSRFGQPAPFIDVDNSVRLACLCVLPVPSLSHAPGLGNLHLLLSWNFGSPSFFDAVLCQTQA
ncbi:hypothetical protein Nepgr_020371 [Nepenthes gracilis]|uniref:Secreted protein n=1 Tax=Nepenthes gracilis TaxID=150966 RepID=A0AAD3SV83_NEPGR|nr:hypothetical protein Nepgr_020371 [Nepenthes gracilis]